MRLRHPLRPLILPALYLFVTVTASAGASPPVPNKQGPLAPLPGARVGERKFNPAAAFPGRATAPLQSAQTVNVLAIRAQFTDTPIESTAAYYDRLLLFMNQYWTQQSGGQVTLNVTLWPVVFTLPHPLAYYGDDARFQERLVYLVRDVVGAADPTVDFRLYQSLVIFHAGVGQEADVLDNSRDAIWSAFVTKEDMAEVLPDTSGIGVPTNDEISPGVYYHVKEAVELPEIESQDGYIFGMTGVTCHEFGHQVGTLRNLASMPDLYDTTPDEGGYSHGLGAWDLMAEGVWNYNGFVPAGLSAWTRYWLGFLAPQRVTADASLSLAQLERPIGAIPRAIQVPVSQSEYFLIENRRRDLNDNHKFDFDDANGDGLFEFYTDSYAGAEFDFYVPGDTTGAGAGALIYHVDNSKIQAGLPTNTVEGDTQRKGIDVEEAGGVQDLDGAPGYTPPGTGGDAFRDGWYNAFASETNPSSDAYGGVSTEVAVRDISAADSIMTMTLTIGGTHPGWPKTLSGRIGNSPSVAADLDGDGKLELLVPIRGNANSGALYIFRWNGTGFLHGAANPTPFATTPGTNPTSSPCVGSIDADPELEIVFSTLNGAIYAYNQDSTEVMDGDKNPGTTGVLVAPPAVSPGSQAQPILADLNGDGRMEIIVGGPATAAALGGSKLTVASLAGDSLTVFTLPMAGSTEGPAAAADLNGDGLPEVIIANVPTIVEDNGVPGISIASWDILNDPDLPAASDGDFQFYLIKSGGPYSAPVLADINRDGRFEALLADLQGGYHALQINLAPHAGGDPPVDPTDPAGGYVTTSELAGWPVSLPGKGRISEVSLGDLEGDGYPEVLHTGQDVRVTAYHYNGAMRTGYPVEAAAPYAAADTAGFWPPLVADVDGDGIRDVIPILPDGRRPAYRADGPAIGGFVGLGSTGGSSPPMLIDLDDDGVAEWVESHDSGLSAQLQPQSVVIVRSTPWPVSATSLSWTQYRNSATRNAVVPAGPAGPPPGTQILSAVYGYPNPSRTGSTTIHYSLSAPATSVHVKIVDATGETVAEPPVTAADLAGSAEHTVVWDHGTTASGVYRCRVEVQFINHGTEVQFAGLAILR